MRSIHLTWPALHRPTSQNRDVGHPLSPKSNKMWATQPAGTPGARAGTRPQAILDAIKNPTKVTSGIDSQGRPYQAFTGKDARVVVNPSSGRIVSVNPLSGAGAH